MDWNLLFFFNSILLGFGLAMDAFSVSLVNGLNEINMRPRKMFKVAGVFAFFQFLMPMTGWLLVHTLLKYCSLLERFVPWIAMALLLYIGGDMLKDGLKKNSEKPDAVRVTLKLLLVQGIATSLDALSVGFTAAEYSFDMALVCSLIIAAVTLMVCMTGLMIGKKAGARLMNHASILGGVILIAIGVEILLKNIF